MTTTKGPTVTDELPPLPEPAARVQQYELPAHIDGHLVACSAGHALSDWEGLYTADQLRAAVLAERDRCAKVCEAEAESLGSSGKRDASALCCAAAIRAETTKRPEPKPGACNGQAVSLPGDNLSRPAPTASRSVTLAATAHAH